MKPLSRWGLAPKLVIPFVLVYLANMLLWEVVFASSLQGALQSSLEEKSGIMVKNLSTILAEPLAIGEYDRVDRLLKEVKASDKDVSYAHLVSPDSRIVATTDGALKNRTLEKTERNRELLACEGLSQRQGDFRSTFEWITPVEYQQTELGYLRVGISTRRTAELVKSTSLAILEVGIASLLLGVGVYFYLARRVVINPLKQLVRLFSKVSEGDLEVQWEESQLKRGDELGMLWKATDSMVSYLREMAGMADALAGGNLKVNVTPRSESDKFGNAFQKMVNAMTFEMITMQDILDNMEFSSMQVTTASAELAETARQQESSISEQAVASSDIVATMSEISATAKELSRTMDEVSYSALQASGLATQGQGLIGKMQDSMDKTISASTSIGHKLENLSNKASKISSVVTTISKVAEQTDLLSLNAAIEAEKAGEFGKGFGVVAFEIRRLSDQTAMATLDIEHTINEVQRAVAEGVKSIREFTGEVLESADAANVVVQSLGEIIGEVKSMNSLFDSVNSSMKCQADAAEQIVDSVCLLSDATRQTQTNIKSFNDVAASLHETTSRLSAAVTRHGGRNSSEDQR